MKALSLTLLTVVIIIAFGCAPETIRYETKYELQRVPEEGNIKLTLITSEQDALWKINYRPETINNNIPFKIFDISKDGNKIVFVGEKDKPKTNLFVKSLMGSKAVLQRTFRDDITCGVFSPDGKSICFTDWKNSGTQELFFGSAESGVATQQLTKSGFVSYPVFSPDGKSIFYSQTDNGWGIWQVELESGKVMQYGMGYQVDFIPGTKSVVYVRYNQSTTKSEIWMTDLDKGQEFTLVADKDRSFYSPAVSPDGKSILIVGVTLGSGTKPNNYDIYKVNIDGSKLTQLTYHAGNDFCPRWSPDGKSFYFVSERGNKDGNFNIWQMDLQ